MSRRSGTGPRRRKHGGTRARSNEGDAVPDRRRVPSSRSLREGSRRGSPGGRASQLQGLALCDSVPRLRRTYAAAKRRVNPGLRRIRKVRMFAARSARRVTFRCMSLTDLEDVAWDLEPLVDGRGSRGRRPPARRGRRARRRASPARTPAGVADLDGAGLAAAMAELQRDRRARRPRRATTPRCASRSTPPTRPTARCSRACSERATAIETKLLFFDLEWAALDDERAEELLARRRPRDTAATTCAPSAATARTCSPSPRRRS